MKFSLILLLIVSVFEASSAQRCNSTSFCYGYGDPHYIRFDDARFDIGLNCRSVLLADSADFNGAFSVTAIPLVDATTGAVSIDEIRVTFGANTYSIDEAAVKLNGVVKTLPFMDANVNIKKTGTTTTVDAAQFYLTFGDGFMKLISCVSSPFGLCASTEANPSQSVNKYLPSDQFWIKNTCTGCPAGWSSLNGRCYKYFDGPLTQSAAQSDCQAKNASLATLNTQAKFDLVKSLVTGLVYLSAKASSPKVFAYADGSTSILNFNPGEPDNYGGSNTNLVEGCVQMGSNGLMSDVPCSFTNPYICEINLCDSNQFYDASTDQCVARKLFQGTCSSNDECDISLGLSCQSGKCTCASGQYFVNRCSSCPSGYNFNLGKCFKVSSSSVNYNAAKTQCTNENAQLALANSDAKFSYLQSLGTTTAGYWLGAYALQGLSFRYNDGSTSVFSWTPNNPDNFGSNGYFAAENCLEIYQNGINDKACSGNSGYACEFDICPSTQYYDSVNGGCLNKKSNGGSCTGSDECDTAKGLICQGAAGSKTCGCQAGVIWSGSTCDCPSGWSKFGSGCYQKFDAITKNFNDAQLDCMSKNGRLASVSTDAEYTFVKNLRGSNALSHYVALYAKSPLTFFNFDGTPVISNRWSTGNPDNFGGSSTVIGEGCGEISDGGLNDVACSTNRGYICKIQI